MVQLIMEIDNFRSINKAKIEINKINVIGGVNGCGKSSVSKIFYSFLKANSIQRKDFVLKTIVNKINDIIDSLNKQDNEYNLPDYLTIEDDYSDILNNYNFVLNISKKHEKIANKKYKELEKELVEKCNNLIKILNNDGIDTSFLQDCLNSPEDDDYVDTLYAVHLLHEEYPDYFDYYFEFDRLWDSYSYFKFTRDIYSSNLWFNSMVNQFFGKDSPKLSEISFNEILLNERLNVNNNVHFNVEPNEGNAFNYFFNQEDFINCVFYVDNISIFELLSSQPSKGLPSILNVRSNLLYHIEEIIENLFGKYQNIEPDEEFNDIISKIDNIIKGRYDKNYPRFITDKKKGKNDIFVSGKIETYNSDTPSGIKQIGIIQLLLLNDKLKKGGYLIIDEPEVNLHPEWQFKFAEILVLLAKDLDITLYLNSHSPMFIEAIEVLTQYYDLEDYTNFYMAEEYGEDTYNFVKVDYDNLYDLYDNLAKPYETIEAYRLKAEYKKGNY